MTEHVGLISMGGYYPGKRVAPEQAKKMGAFLRKQTLLHDAYISELEETHQHPGWSESNEEGWVNQPWYEEWLQSLPEKKRKHPFQGNKYRCRVPMDPESIKKSRYPHPMLASDAETIAGAMALMNADVAPEEIDLVLVSSLVPDKHVPLNASLVQHKLKLENAGAYNMDTCCSSFITMMETAMALIKTGIKKNVLVVASSLDSMINDKSTYYSVCTGDAAVAGVVSAVEEGYGFMTSHSMSDGSRHNAIVFKKRKPLLFQGTSQGPTYEQECVTFADPELTRKIGATAQENMLKVVGAALEKKSLEFSDIDFAAFHQPVKWAANAWREAIGLPEDKYIETYELYGNVACASSPTNMLVALEKGLVKQGDNVLMASSGVGENHIAVLQKASPRLMRNMSIAQIEQPKSEKLQEA
ncbi:MAG: 3-oxoacyl-[acyl-carrier-protein] synthase III C-terminal domain-containing protein [Bacteroidales bacterium]